MINSYSCSVNCLYRTVFDIYNNIPMLFLSNCLTQKNQIMKNNFKLLVSFFIAFILLTLQYTANAQARIYNQTDCDIYAYVYQSDDACDICAYQGLVLIPANGFYQQLPDPSCQDEIWLGLRWFDGGPYFVNVLQQGYGAAFNPFLNCAPPDVQGNCQGSPIDVNWLGNANGAGPVNIYLQN